MHAIHTFIALVALVGYLYCDGFVFGQFRSFARPNRQVFPTPSVNAKAALSSVMPLRASLQQSLDHAARLLPADPDLAFAVMRTMVDAMVNPMTISQWASSLDQLGFNASTPGFSELVATSAMKLSTTKELSLIGFAMGLTGLSNTGIKITDYPPDVRLALLEQVERISGSFDPRNLANILKALGKLGESWSALPSATQQSLWQSFESNAPRLVSDNETYHLALTIHSFGHLGLSNHTLTSKQRRLVFEVAVRGINVGVAGQTLYQVIQMNAITMLGLGKMNMDYKELPAYLTNQITRCMHHGLPRMNSLGVRNCLYALALMRCKYSSTAMYTAFLLAAVRHIPVFTCHDIISVIDHFSAAGIRWVQIPSALQARAEAVMLIMTQQRHSDRFLPIFINALANMKADWKPFSPAFHAAVFDAFLVLQDSFNAQGVSNCVHGLERMGTPFDSLGPAFKIAVHKAAHRLSGSATPFKPKRIASWEELSSIAATCEAETDTSISLPFPFDELTD